MKRISTRKFADELTMFFELAREATSGSMPKTRDNWVPFARRLVPHANHHGMMQDLKVGLAYVLQRPELPVGQLHDSPASLEDFETREALGHLFAILWPDDDWRTVPTDDVAFSD